MVKYLLYGTATLLLVSFLLLSTFPKFLFLDRILMKSGIFLLADGIEEGILSMKLKNVRLYHQNTLLLKDGDLMVGLSLSGLKLDINCGDKLSYLNISISKDFQGEFKNLSCLTYASYVDGKLYSRDGVFGKLNLGGIKAQGRSIKSFEIEFKGNTFFFKGDVEGFEVSGSGNLSYQEDNPLNSKINAVASSIGYSITISGTILNPRIDLR
ncbi:MAG: hypothetical protein N2Z80_07520 [Hydrogenothermaceae bacterium]|nr:hypothetical protein [Hydrogenothermaceae bacterium]